jgi:16S rRNA (guanine966-N2)-methyltransferase
MAAKAGSSRARTSHHERGRRERTLRIIGGSWRGRRFRFPPLDIRPTPDRVRETLFNWLQHRVAGAHCLDLYAGSGALGLEALSRGASSVVFVEQQRLAANTLQQLLSDWGAAGASVICGEAQAYLAGGRTQAATAARGFDLVFLDPPYGSFELAAVAARLAQGYLAADARIYVEWGRNDAAPALPATWRELRAGSAGEVGYHLYTP